MDTTTTNVTLDPVMISMAAAMLVPILTGLVTKLGSNSHVKAVAALALSAVIGTVTQITNMGGTFNPKQAGIFTGIVFVTQLGSYLGIWKPMGSTDLVPLQGLTGDFGFGKVTPVPPGA